jgi:hypothetical protein
MLPERNTVCDYFKSVKEKDIDNLIDLFEDQAEIQEPFSKESPLRDEHNFRSFFQIVCMANEELDHDIFFEDETDDNALSVLYAFQKGKTVCARFSFRFGPNMRMNAKGIMERKIKRLQIQFISPYETYETRMELKE